MTKHTANKPLENTAMARRSVLKTGGLMLAGWTTSAFAGKNGQIDKVTLYEDAVKNEKPSMFSWGSQSAPAPATAAAQAAIPTTARTDTSLRAADVQILFVDLQPAAIGGSQSVKPQALADAAGKLAKVARVLNIPMTFAVIPEADKSAKLIPELAPFANATSTLPRQVVGPLLDRPTADRLASLRRKTLIIAGYSTEGAGLQAVLGAIAAGYNVQLPVDAMGGQSERTEGPALKQMETAGAVATSVSSLATLLAPDFSRQPGADVRAVLLGQPVKDLGQGW